MYSKLLVFILLILAACSPGSRGGNKTGEAQESPSTIGKSDTESSKQTPEMTMEMAPDLTKHGIANNSNNVLGGLKVGDLAPDIELEDERGQLVSLDRKLEDGPVLLVFYRADWCSFCVKHLAEFQDKINDIQAAGIASVIAVSPQKQEYSLKLHQENNYTFPILYDVRHQTMKDYKVFFHVTEKYNQYITEVKGDPIEHRNGNTEPVMPVPATYMIGQDKRIKYVHYDPNYRVRADIDDALNALNSGDS